MIGKSGKSGFIMPTAACALIGAAVAVVDVKYSDYAYYHHINIPDWLFVLMLLLNAPRILFVAFIDKQPDGNAIPYHGACGYPAQRDTLWVFSRTSAVAVKAVHRTLVFKTALPVLPAS